MLIEEIDCIFLEELKIDRAALQYLVDGLFVQIPIGMNQPISEFGHFDQSLAKAFIDDAQMIKALEHVGIGFRGFNRFFELKQRNKAVSDVEATFDSQVQKPLNSGLAQIVIQEFVSRQLFHLEQPQAVLVQPFEVLENALIHDTPPPRERRC
jgi:hypothetical protein